jgi:hypothetical protein
MPLLDTGWEGKFLRGTALTNSCQVDRNAEMARYSSAFRTRSINAIETQ